MQQSQLQLLLLLLLRAARDQYRQASAVVVLLAFIVGQPYDFRSQSVRKIRKIIRLTLFFRWYLSFDSPIALPTELRIQYARYSRTELVCRSL
jgi:hypothetical protein